MPGGGAWQGSVTRAVRGLSLRLTAAAATTEPATSRVKHLLVLELVLVLVLVLVLELVLVLGVRIFSLSLHCLQNNGRGGSSGGAAT